MNKLLVKIAEHEKDLSIDWLRTQIHYDPTTGKLFSKVNRSIHKVGDELGGMNRKYLVLHISSKNYMAHRLAWMIHFGQKPRYFIDHINGVKTDNRIDNLRDVETVFNAHNIKRARSDNKLGILGVIYSKRARKFISYISLPNNGKSVCLGRFNDADSAQTAYLNAKKKLHSGFIGIPNEKVTT